MKQLIATCDKCGAVEPTTNGQWAIEKALENAVSKYGALTVKQIDLCEKCRDRLYRGLNDWWYRDLEPDNGEDDDPPA